MGVLLEKAFGVQTLIDQKPSTGPPSAFSL